MGNKKKFDSTTGLPRHQIQVNLNNKPSNWNANEKAIEMAKVAQSKIEGKTPIKLNSKTWVYK